MTIEAYQAFTPRIHPTAFIHVNATVIGDVEVGEEASLWPAAVLRGDSGRITVGARTSIQDGSVIHATTEKTTTRVGAECTVGHRVVLHGCQVGDHCLVGMGSILLDEVEVGEWCFIGAGSMLTPGKKFPPRSFILGSPGRRLREVTEDEIRGISYSWGAYQELCRNYRGRK